MNGYAHADITLGLVGHWDFEDVTGGIARDVSGVSNDDGVIHGATSVPGVSGLALSFNGSTDYIDVPHSEELNPTDAITVTAWFRADTFDLDTYSWPHVVDKAGSPDPTGYFMLIAQVYENNPCVGFAIDSVGGIPAGADLGEPKLDINTWYFSAGVYDGSTLSVYVGTSERTDLVLTSENYSGTMIMSSNNLKGGISLTAVTTRCSSRVHGGLSENADGPGASVCDGGGL